MTATIIRLADYRKPPTAAIGPAWNPNWFAIELAEAYQRLFGSFSNFWGDTAQKLRAADLFDDARSCDYESPGPSGDAA